MRGKKQKQKQKLVVFSDGGAAHSAVGISDLRGSEVSHTNAHWHTHGHVRHDAPLFTKRGGGLAANLPATSLCLLDPVWR